MVRGRDLGPGDSLQGRRQAGRRRRRRDARICNTPSGRPMNELTEKVRCVEADIAREKGALNLFALFERAALYDRWDLVVSAPWARHDLHSLRYIADVIKRHLAPEDMVSLARIVVLPAYEDPVRSINERYDLEPGKVELNDPARFGLPVKGGYIITSRAAA